MSCQELLKDISKGNKNPSDLLIIFLSGMFFFFVFLMFLKDITKEEHTILSGQALLLNTMEQLEETKISS